MSSENISLKDDLANLFKELEEVKRETKNVTPKINKSDITNLFSDLEEVSKETKVVEKKHKDYIKTSKDDVSNLLQELEKTSKQTNKKRKSIKEKTLDKVKVNTDNSLENLMKDLSVAFEESKNEKNSDQKIEIVEKIELNPKPEIAEVFDETAKLEEFEQLFSGLVKVEPEVKEELKVEVAEEFIISTDDNIKTYAEQIKNTAPKINPQQHDIYESDIIDFESLKKEFIRFKARTIEQLGSIGGGGEVNLSKLDDVSVSGQEDGDVLTYNKTTGKYELKRSTSTANTGQLLLDQDGSNVVLNAIDSSGSSEGDDILLEVGVDGGRDLDHNILQTLTSDIIPAQTGTFNLGSPSKRFQNIYLESNTIDLGGSTISSDGTGQIIVSAAGATLPVGSKDTDGKELLTVIAESSTSGVTAGQATKTVPLYTQASGLSTAAVNFTFSKTLSRRSVFTNSGHTFLLSNGDDRSDLTPELFEF